MDTFLISLNNKCLSGGDNVGLPAFADSWKDVPSVLINDAVLIRIRLGFFLHALQNFLYKLQNGQEVRSFARCETPESDG